MNIFQNSYSRRPKKNAFNLSQEKKLTMNMASLVPFYHQEVIPGDRFKGTSEVLMRLAPMVSPVMHRINVTTHFWFVPNRTIWDSWKDFITGGEDGTFTSGFPKINITAANYADYGIGSLADYFGLPIPPSAGITQALSVSALPFRAYASIFNEYYRDQNLQDKIPFTTNDAVDEAERAAIVQLQTRNWEKDYFTSALPFAQKGDPVQAPIDITYAGEAKIAGGDGTSYPTTAGSLVHDTAGNISSDQGATWNEIENIDPDATGIDVEKLRVAVRLQEWLERNARAGSRYVESIMSHFGERVPDYTAQRPVFLGGGRSPVTISEVLQTGATGTDTSIISTPQGNMAGHGISVDRGTNTFKGKFTEHGQIIGIMSVLPRTAYQQGVERSWLKFDKFSYFWPSFAQLGEQEVLQAELYMDYMGATGQRDKTFGYQSRYADMKYKSSQVAGDFRQNLAFWHLGRQFANDPALNDEFIKADPRQDIFAVTDPSVHKLYVQIFNNIKALRPIPSHNVPTL